MPKNWKLSFHDTYLALCSKAWWAVLILFSWSLSRHARNITKKNRTFKIFSINTGLFQHPTLERIHQISTNFRIELLREKRKPAGKKWILRKINLWPLGVIGIEFLLTSSALNHSLRRQQQIMVIELRAVHYMSVFKIEWACSTSVI